VLPFAVAMRHCVGQGACCHERLRIAQPSAEVVYPCRGCPCVPVLLLHLLCTGEQEGGHSCADYCGLLERPQHGLKQTPHTWHEKMLAGVLRYSRSPAPISLKVSSYESFKITSTNESSLK
jgi:hypothetical protein